MSHHAPPPDDRLLRRIRRQKRKQTRRRINRRSALFDRLSSPLVPLVLQMPPFGPEDSFRLIRGTYYEAKAVIEEIEDFYSVMFNPAPAPVVITDERVASPTRHLQVKKLDMTSLAALHSVTGFGQALYRIRCHKGDIRAHPGIWAVLWPRTVRGLFSGQPVPERVRRGLYLVRIEADRLEFFSSDYHPLFAVRTT